MKPKVLIFIDWFAPGYKAGGPTTSNINIVDNLSDYIDFYVITSDMDYHATKPYENITSNQWLSRGNCNVYYFSREALSFNNLLDVAKDAGCDIWYINGIYSRFFSIYPLLLRKLIKPQKVIVAARGMLSPHALTVKSSLKSHFLACAKLLRLYNGVVFHGTNDEECQYIHNVISPKQNCLAISNLPRKIKVKAKTSCKESKYIKLVSFARVSPEKNTLFAISVLKECKQKILYDIYGQINSNEYWSKCLNEIEKLPSNITVEYKGAINPNMLEKLYDDYDALYLPSTGENFGHAILESLMFSRPVVISDRTPWRDLANMGVGYDIPLDDANVFARVLDSLALMPKDEYDIYCSRAYKFACDICNDEETKLKYLSMLK